jgi:hypothetical protein
MPNNSEIRHRVRLRVELTGVDSTGHPFKQTVFTHNVSEQGVRLEEAPPLLEPTSVVQLDHQGKKRRFRVVWVGGRASSEVGLTTLEQSTGIWGTPLPGRAIRSTAPPHRP